MKKFLALVFLLFSTSALADTYVAMSGEAKVTLYPGVPCETTEVVAKLAEFGYDKAFKAEVLYKGETRAACFVPLEGGVGVLDEKGGAGAIPEESFHKELEV